MQNPQTLPKECPTHPPQEHLLFNRCSPPGQKSPHAPEGQKAGPGSLSQLAPPTPQEGSPPAPQTQADTQLT